MPGPKPSDDFVARIVIDAELLGDADCGAQHNVSRSTINRYRTRVKTDVALAALVERLRESISASWAATRKTVAERVVVTTAAAPIVPADESLLAYIERTSPPSHLPVPQHLLELINLLERAITSEVFAIVTMPPRHGKTTTVRKALAWAMKRFPDRLNALGMYAERNAYHHSRAIRRMVLEDGVKLLAGAQSVGLWQTQQEGGLFAAGITGQWTSKGFGGAIFLDDIVKGREQADSEVVREKIWGTLNDDVITRTEPPCGSVVFINTRWHEDDPSGRLQARLGTEDWPTFELINLPALRDPKTGLPSDSEDAVALWPERFPVKTLRRRRAMLGPYSWSALYQGQPAPAAGAVFKKDWLQEYWTELPPDGEFVQSWDMGFAKIKQSQDNVVGQVWYRAGTHYYLVDQVCRRMNFAETVDAVRALSVKWPEAKLKLIEAKANGPGVVRILQEEFPGFVLLNPQEQGSKIARARATEAFFASKHVHIPHPQLAVVQPHKPEMPTGAAWLPGWLSEMLSFPSGKNDDQVDATTQALNYLATPEAKGADWSKVGSIFTEGPRVGWRG